MGYRPSVKVCLQSIGCRLNTGEMDALARQFAAKGCQVVPPRADVDICLLNTCTVTATAAQKSRKAIRRLRREMPASFFVVTGCDSELDPESAVRAGADLTVSNEDKDKVMELLATAEVIPSSALQPQDVFKETAPTRTRAFVKVQDGCNYSCAYCIVTVARGECRSRPATDVFSEISTLERTGIQEIVLTGVHLGSYDHDHGNSQGLAQLVQAVLDQTSIERVRLSSVEPWDVTDDLLREFSNPRLLPHLHLPLQSGCDATLRRMARRTTCDEFRILVDKIRSIIPNVAISTDVMVGFPGETDADFDQSLSFVKEIGFSRLHVFRYSRREGTAASTMPNPISKAVSQQRSAAMLATGEHLSDIFAHSQVGRIVPVLWEDNVVISGQTQWRGLTPNYLRVLTFLPPSTDLSNQIVDTRLERVLPNGLLGVLVEQLPQESFQTVIAQQLPLFE
ncbi:MAG: tRNA (N(6)-L-threonylcarbamoyladenosine(37)-C(2))-methylthiotransferase MtaB [bacterium]|nr:tRNA (N(6)-L-threonylcarbamoyladenosine(37)-C(2))-methylthiotransferase MtaB [bacterium]